MVAEDREDYKLSAKTGLSSTDRKYNGWYVGYLEIGTQVYFFATNIEPKEPFDFSTFVAKRKEVTFDALKELKVI